jgi:hypothetical protein
VGYVKPLSFAKTAVGSTTTANNGNSAWKISANDDDNDEYIDEDELLDEEDLKRPDPASLRGILLEISKVFRHCWDIVDLFEGFFLFIVCGTTGKRKACKDCSCGLAEEIMGGGEAPVNALPKSSCGSVRTQ